MGLEGDLTHFSLPDIIQLIGMGKRSGMLALKKDNLEGTLYFKEGQPIHALFNHLKGEEAAYNLFNWNHGNFKFENNITPPEETINLNWMNLIMEGARHVDELEKIKTKIPSFNIIYEPVENTHKETADINLSPKEWNVLSLMDGKRTCRDIIEKTGYGELETLKVIYELLSAGILSKKEVREEDPFKEDVIKNKIIEILANELGKNSKNIEKKVLTAKISNKEDFYTLCVKIEKFIFLFVDSKISVSVKEKILTIIPKN